MKLETKLEFKIEVLQQSQSMNTPSATKVRRKLFADSDSTPLNPQSVRNDAMRLLKDDYERFKQKYNYDFDKNKPLEGPWDWNGVESSHAPTFYTQAYIAKTPESLKKHHMSCLKDRDQYLRNNSPFYRNGHYFQSLALTQMCDGDDEVALLRTSSTTVTSNTHPDLHATPYKKRSNLILGSSPCGTKRKLSQEDDDDDDVSSNSSDGIREDYDEDGDTSDANTVDNNLTFPDTLPSPSPLRSSSSLSSLSSKTPLHASSTTHHLSIQSQETGGYNLQNKLCTKITTANENNQPSSQTTPQTSLRNQGNYLRQTNIKEFMKSQKNASEPTAKHSRTA